MRRLLLLLALSSPLWGQVTFTGDISSVPCGGANPCTVTITAGHADVVAIDTRGNDTGGLTLTSSQGDVFTKIVNTHWFDTGLGVDFTLVVWVNCNMHGGSTTFTVSGFSGSSLPRLYDIFDYSGTATSGCTNGSVAQANGAGPSTSGGAITTGVASLTLYGTTYPANLSTTCGAGLYAPNTAVWAMMDSSGRYYWPVMYAIVDGSCTPQGSSPWTTTYQMSSTGAYAYITNKSIPSAEGEIKITQSQLIYPSLDAKQTEAGGL